MKLYLQNARSVNIEAFIKEQPASIVSAFVLYRYFLRSLSADEIIKYTALLEIVWYQGIPGNVLIDPSGKIIARNLRGDELEKKLAELLP
jgi:hypothetical protein